jgi:hypothetical protein
VKAGGFPPTDSADRDAVEEVIADLVQDMTTLGCAVLMADDGDPVTPIVPTEHEDAGPAA